MTEDRIPYVWSSRWGVSIPSMVTAQLSIAPLPTARCRRCGRFRRDSRVPRHICPALRRKVRP